MSTKLFQTNILPVMSRSPNSATRKSSTKPQAPAQAPQDSPTNRILEIVDVLRERIASQQVPPGSKLLEQDLAEEFNAPRTAVREALAALEQRGLIERIPNRGAVVMRLELSQVFHIYDTREVLEGLCSRLATEKSQPAAPARWPWWCRHRRHRWSWKRLP